MKRQTYIIAILLMGLLGGLSALPAGDGFAGMPGTYLHMGVGARALAMGNAYTALSQDGTALYWNPAGLANQDPYQLYFMHSSLFMSTNFDYVAATAPTRQYGNFGLGIIALTSGEFDQRNELNEPLGNFGMTDMAFLLSWSKELYYNVAVGLNYKLVSQRMLDYSGIGHGIDLGLRRRFFGWLNTGLTVVNLIPPHITMADAGEDFPRQLRVGAATTLLNDKLLVSTDVAKIIGWGETRLNIGIEYQAIQGVDVRIGLNNGRFTMGAGFTFNKIGMGYGNKNSPDLGMNHLFAVNYSFGGFGIGAEAFPNVFSPAGEQNISRIRLKVKSRSAIRNWSFEIMNTDGEVIRNFAQGSNLPEEVIWDGRDDNGTFAEDGEFSYRFEVITVEGRTYRANGNLVAISTQGPSGTLGVVNEESSTGVMQNEN